MASIKDYRIESDVAVDGATIKAITDGEEQEDVDIIGHIISYTIGSDFVVPREWLENRMEELELFITAPDGDTKLMIPPKVTPKRAFNRTRDRLIDEVTASHPDFHGDGRREINGRATQFESKKATNDEWHITAEAYFTVDELNRGVEGEPYDDGEFRQTTLAVVRYNKEHEEIITAPKIDEDDAMWDTWETLAEETLRMFKEMQESNIGRDLQKMVNRFTHHWTDTIKVRDGGAVYFVPAGYDDEVRSLKTLIDEINTRFKHRGSDCEILRISVTDSEEEKKQIEEKARKHLEGQVESALDAAFEALAEDEAVAGEIATEIEDRLESIDEFAGDYNALLSARLSAQEVLEDKVSDLDGVKQDIVEDVLKGQEGEAPTA